jgi:hypothetical protein
MSFGLDDCEAEDRSYYDVAQICLNGHLITSHAETFPDGQRKFCANCGESTTKKCLACSANIRGYYHVPGVISLVDSYAVPAFCADCGKAYAWTERRLQAAKDLTAELDGLDGQEKAILSNSLEDLVRDTPQTTVAATRFKNLASKAGRTGAESLKTIMVDIVSEAAKKLIWP